MQKPPLTPLGKLAHKLGLFCQRFLSLPDEVWAVLPVWIIHTYVYERFAFTPYLYTVSPEPGCGKTTFGDVLSSTCARATSPLCGSVAFLRRKVAAEKPCLILDEWDSLDDQVRKACMNFLNTGFRWDGTYSIMI